MKMKPVCAIACVTAFCLLFSANLTGQERNDVIAAYNAGAKAMQTDTKTAIESFESAIELAGQVGESADDLKQKAMQVLPGLYYKLAATAYNEKKPVEEIITAAKEAMTASEKYNNATHRANAERVLGNAYYRMATDYLTAQEYDNALLALDSVLTISPDHSAAIYSKAIAFRSLNESAAFGEAIELFISKLDPEKDTDKINQANNTALEYYRVTGSREANAGNLDEALELLNSATKFGEEKTLFYFLADVYNKKNEFTEGAEYARKGLDLETGDAEAKAMYYYQLAVAQAGKGDVDSACASFKNALYGPFAEAAKAQRTNLKCE